MKTVRGTSVPTHNPEVLLFLEIWALPVRHNGCVSKLLDKITLCGEPWFLHFLLFLPKIYLDYLLLLWKVPKISTHVCAGLHLKVQILTQQWLPQCCHDCIVSSFFCHSMLNLVSMILLSKFKTIIWIVLFGVSRYVICNFLGCLTFEGGADMLIRNVGKYRSMLHNIPESEDLIYTAAGTWIHATYPCQSVGTVWFVLC